MSVLGSLELEFRRAVRRRDRDRNGARDSGDRGMSAYNTLAWSSPERPGLGRRRGRPKRANDGRGQKKRKMTSSSSSSLAEFGKQLFADYGKPVSGDAPKRMSAAELETKRLSLPFVDTIEFVRLQLERRGIHSAGGSSEMKGFNSDTESSAGKGGQKRRHSSVGRESNAASRRGHSAPGLADIEIDLSGFIPQSFQQHREQKASRLARRKGNKRYANGERPIISSDGADDSNIDDADDRKHKPNAYPFNEMQLRARYPIFADFLAPRDKESPSVHDRPASWLLRLIEEIYDARYDYDCQQQAQYEEGEHREEIALAVAAHEAAMSGMSTQSGSPVKAHRPLTINTPAFCYKFLEKQLGLRALTQQTAWDLLHNVNRHMRAHPEVEFFSHALRELIKTEHFLFFLRAREVMQREFDVKMATRGKINVSLSSPGVIMQNLRPHERGGTHKCVGSCLLTEHPLIPDRNTRLIWLSLDAARRVVRGLLPDTALVDYLLSIKFNCSESTASAEDWEEGTMLPALPIVEFVLPADGGAPVKRANLTGLKIGNDATGKDTEIEEEDEEEDNDPASLSDRPVASDPKDVIARVVSVTSLLWALVKEIQSIPEEEQNKFKHGDDSETVVLLERLQQTQRNKVKVDTLRKRLQNERIACMSQQNKVIMLERKGQPDIYRTQIFLAKSQLFKLTSIANATEESVNALLAQDDRVWNNVMGDAAREEQEMTRRMKERREMAGGGGDSASSSNISTQGKDGATQNYINIYSEDVGMQLHIFESWIKSEHLRYQRKITVAKAFGKTYAQQLEDRKIWAANTLAHNFRARRAARIAKEKADIEMAKAREERRIRNEKRRAANAALAKRREVERLKQQAELDAKRAADEAVRRAEDERKHGKRRRHEANKRFRKKRREILRCRWKRWAVMFVGQRKMKAQRLRESCTFVWSRWRGFVVMRRAWHTKRDKAAEFIQRMARCYICRNSVAIFMRKKKEREARAQAFLRKVKYGFAHKVYLEWQKLAETMRKVRNMLNSSGIRFAHLCVKEWRAATEGIRREKTAAATRIQNCWRCREGMAQYLLNKLRNNAANTIANAYRAYCARTFLKRARKTRAEEEAKIKKQLWRMRNRKLIAAFDEWYEEAYRLRVFRRLIGKGHAALTEEHFDAWAEYYRTVRPAASLIQATYRSFDARVKLQSVFLFARSARKIQNWMRSVAAWWAVQAMRRHRNAATLIQTAWRTKNHVNAFRSRLTNGLLAAVREKDYLQVEAYFERGRGFLSDREGKNALHMACEVGSKRIAKLCLRKGISVNVQDLMGRTCLHYICTASYPGTETMLEYLISKGAIRDASDVLGATPLHYAARLDHVECVEALLVMNARADKQDVRGSTPLHDAGAAGMVSSVRTLLSAYGHADPDIPDHDGCTVLHDACARGMTHVLHEVLPVTSALNDQDHKGLTPLAHAIHGCHDECVRMLLESGADSHICDNTGTFPVHICSQDDRRLAILRMLCESFADLDVVDADQQTALHLACISGVEPVARLLLSSGAQPEPRDDRGCQPIHLSARHNTVKCAKLLFEYEVDVNVRNWDGITAIGEARMNNHAEMLALFDERFVLSTEVAFQRKVTLASNLGVDPPAKVEEEKNVGELEPGADETPFWEAVIARSLKYRDFGNEWEEYKEVLPPPEIIIAERQRAKEEKETARKLLQSGSPFAAAREDHDVDEVEYVDGKIVEKKKRKRRGEEYELRHWWRNTDTGACTYMFPWALQQGEWEPISLDEENALRKQKARAARDADETHSKDADDDHDHDKEEEKALIVVETKPTHAASVGAQLSTTRWINRALGTVCVGLPPTMLRVGEKRILEQRNLNEAEKKLREKEERESQRASKLKGGMEMLGNDEEDAPDISLVDYQAYFEKEKQELQEMIDRWNAALVIESQYRGHMARKRYKQLTRRHYSSILIQKRARGMIDRKRVRVMEIHMKTSVTLQRRRRGAICRRRLRVLYPMLRRRRAILESAQRINRIWRGYLSRREKRRLWWRRYGPTSQSEWSHLKNGASDVETGGHTAGSVLIRSEIYHGKYDLYRVASTWDVLFYYDRIRGTCSWDKPTEVAMTEARERIEDRQLRLRGFTAEQARVASKLQAAWRGKKMVEQFRVIVKAKNIMRTCVDDYMREPHSIERTFNYMLYVHLFPPHDIDRARPLYVKAMETMTNRGPDHPSVLYAFLIFSTATREEDEAVLFELWRRARVADAARNQKRSAFELSEIGFYRMAAVFHPEDAICQMNYAICLQWLRQDWEQSEEFYQKAARLTHGR